MPTAVQRGMRQRETPPTWQAHLENTEQHSGLLKRAVLRLVNLSMGDTMIRALLAAILSLWLTTSAWAGFDEGQAAYERGDYATALEECCR